MTNEELWQAVLGEVELAISRANFITWFKHTSIAQNEHNGIVVHVPNAFTKEWLENKYHKLIMRALRSNNPDVRSIEYVISSSPPPIYTLDTPSRPQAVVIETTGQEEQLDFQDFSVDKETNLNPRYTFDTFVVGGFNELAHAAAMSVVKNIASLYNPLFIYGGVGLGKTHLLQSIGNAVKKENPSLSVHYATSEKFTNDLITAIQNNEPQRFKDRYRKFDVLIIDDIQFIAGKVRTQEEFFHTFNALYENNKQVIFSSDRPPKSIPDLEERLRSRFEAGLIADVSQPDYETRLAITRSKAAARNLSVPPETLEYIASAVEKNIRELEGALNIVVARSKVLGRPLTPEETKEILLQIINKPKKVITAARIIKEVCQLYDIQERHLFERSRRREIVRPRQIAMYLLRQDFGGSFPYIGQKFGGRDHTTAIHAYEKILRDMKTDTKLSDEINMLRDQIYET
ncbi:MAG: chromosomal replication initiator protein DnaA [Candidatus Ryanbacteria bacterium CG10_big_fil_rev_8_21_14_0_10_43_42]|uniref:Chromosomal replication initiator protein DnaA n=1 Tax=Candidatus Ryanbacteria bacterium CG10_big_fil_rev_8_21_14_0_10_43_42 TaxID=1974864 RepID=A0A2M8KWA4_9BACT|nr:MAG: chromosomal replication initiator protein DnaA [Candidatus Ryanbacteria bacterium CG10_big_fil_rev_8_21_14_0_10_43_42]